MNKRTIVNYQPLRTLLKSDFQEHMPLSAYTTIQTGGLADGLVIAQNMEVLEKTVNTCWDNHIPYQVLGNASNVLISDTGYHGVIIINQTKQIIFSPDDARPSVSADSGVKLGTLAHQAAKKGLSGLEWAAGIPGTVGGAVYGNAGAHGQDIQSSLILAEILQPISGRENWVCDQFGYAYRSSILKRDRLPAVILIAQFRLSHSTEDEVSAAMQAMNAKRRSSQPSGASMGSMFRNPAGDYAGRLIEAAGLKGTRIGGVQISQQHANFFINDDNAHAQDIYNLITLVQKTVNKEFNIDLELEVELLGEWND